MIRYNVPVRFNGNVTFQTTGSLDAETLMSVAQAVAQATTDNPDAPVEGISITEDRLDDEGLQAVLDSATVGGFFTVEGAVEHDERGTHVPVAFAGTVTVGAPDELTEDEQRTLAGEAAIAQVVSVVNKDAPLALIVDESVSGVELAQAVESAFVGGAWNRHERYPIERRMGRCA